MLIKDRQVDNHGEYDADCDEYEGMDSSIEDSFRKVNAKKVRKQILGKFMTQK
jgi:hypothetical protein